MNQPIVIVGIGELGGVFARAFLRNGYPVYPVTRSMNISDQADSIPQPELVLVAVAENDFKAVMATIPAAWRKCVCADHQYCRAGFGERHHHRNPLDTTQ